MDGMILRNGENVTPEVREQNPLVDALARLCVIGRVGGKYLWAKLTEQDGNLLELLVSSNENAYSEGTGADGYYYMRVYHVLGIDSKGDTFVMEL